RPPPPTSTLSPYTTLFRSGRQRIHVAAQDRGERGPGAGIGHVAQLHVGRVLEERHRHVEGSVNARRAVGDLPGPLLGVYGTLHIDRKSTRLNSSHVSISYA